MDLWCHLGEYDGEIANHSELEFVQELNPIVGAVDVLLVVSSVQSHQ
jgi:hypothetical protein